MPTMNGGQALIEALKIEGVSTIFGIPGAGQYEAIDAIYQTPEIRYFSVRNEQAATYMADGYARASGEIAAALLVPGPGFYNATSGVATAQATCSPLLVITGSRNQSRPDWDSDELTVMKRLTKWSAAAHSVGEIPLLVHEAIYQLKHGTPQPVGLEIAPAIFAQSATIDFVKPGRVSHPPPDPDLVAHAAERLAGAENAVLWAGGGVQRAAAWAELVRLAEYLQIPVVTSRQGKGVISDRHPLSLGLAELRYAPLRQWLESRDLIVCIGSSVDLTSFEQPVLRIDTDVCGLGRKGEPVAIENDAQVVLKALCEAVEQLTANRAGKAAKVQAEVRALNRQRFAPEHQLHPQWELMRAVRRAVPADAILVQGMNQMGYYSRNYFPVFAPRAYLTASDHATLGCAYPIGLGAKVACPERAVVVLSGDGGFLYNSQEMATAVLYDIHVVTLVFNDHAYGNVLRAQKEEFDGHIVGTRLHNPDFVQLAEAYGVKAMRAHDADQLEQALRTIFSVHAPSLIEVPVGPLDRVY